MFTIKKRSKWSFDTSGGVSMSVGPANGGIGTITLKTPAGNSIMYTMAAMGAGVGIGAKYGVSGSHESFTSAGAVYLLDQFGRDELTRDDIEGFFISRDASLAVGNGASGSAMLLGIPLSSVPAELLLQILRSGDGIADVIGSATGHPRLVRLLMAPTGLTTLGAILDTISPYTFETRAKALLLTGGKTVGGLGLSASVAIGYMWAPGVPKLGADPRQSLPNIDLPMVETVTMRYASTSQDEADVIRLPGDLLFGFDRADIRPAAEEALRKAAALIEQRRPRALSVEGHTDAIGEAGYNADLSNRRAQAVARWLANRKIAKTSAIHTKGWGTMRPVAQNVRPDGTDDPAGRQKNRRVEIWLIR